MQRATSVLDEKQRTQTLAERRQTVVLDQNIAVLENEIKFDTITTINLLTSETGSSVERVLLKADRVLGVEPVYQQVRHTLTCRQHARRMDNWFSHRPCKPSWRHWHQVTLNKR
jgi:hypothetical protein